MSCACTHNPTHMHAHGLGLLGLRPVSQSSRHHQSYGLRALLGLLGPITFFFSPSGLLPLCDSPCLPVQTSLDNVSQQCPATLPLSFALISSYYLLRPPSSLPYLSSSFFCPVWPCPTQPVSSEFTLEVAKGPRTYGCGLGSGTFTNLL